MISSGDILTTGAARAGYWALTFRTYPAEIKGGPCMYQVRIGVESVLSQGDSVDLLVCFNQEAFDLHHQELADDGHLVCDAESVRVTPEYESRSSEVALGAIAQESGGNRRGKNMVSVGLVCGLLGVDTARIEEMILKRYAHKGDVGESNIRSLRAGFEHARDDLPEGGTGSMRRGRPMTIACSCRATRRSASAPSMRDCGTTPATRSLRPATSSNGWRPGCPGSAASRSRPRTRSPHSRPCSALPTRARRR